MKGCPLVGRERLELLPHAFVTSIVGEGLTPTGNTAFDPRPMAGWVSTGPGLKV